MKTAIVTDTNSGITADEAQELGVHLLAMPVIIDDHGYLEGVDIRAEQLYEAMRQERRISTSQPSPGSVLEMWTSIFEAGYDEIVHIPMSSGLSGSCQSAALLAGEFGHRVCVVDNHRISVTQRESVLEAKRMAEAGSGAQDIKRFLEETAFRTSIYLTVASLKYLQMGGRLSQTAATLGTILNIKPILSIQGEKIDVVDKARGIRNCGKKMIEAIQNDIAARFAGVPERQLRVAVAGTLLNREDIDLWRQAVQACFPHMTVDYAPLPCSIACHVGPDCVGVGVMETHR